MEYSPLSYLLHFSSPLVATNGVNPLNPVRKDFTCPICAKEYSNYMSLYMHKKTKHPNTGPPGSSISPNGVNMAPLTPTGGTYNYIIIITALKVTNQC